jgi:hypothetical protein
VLRVALEPAPCPRCQDEDVRPSRRPRALLARLLGLWRHRCMACRLVIFSRARLDLS